MDLLSTFYTDDFEFSSPFVQNLTGVSDGRLKGLQEVREYWEVALRGVVKDDILFELKGVYLGAESLIIHYNAGYCFGFGVFRMDIEGVDRRTMLVRMLALGAVSGSGSFFLSACVTQPPLRIRAGIHKLEGKVWIDGQPARLGAEARMDSRIETGPGAMLVLVVGLDAFLLQEESQLQLIPQSQVRLETALAQADPSGSTLSDVTTGPGMDFPLSISGFELSRGKILSVFAPGRRSLKTPSAVIGIRGTGIYVESIPGEDYICVCYGKVDIQALADPSVRTSVESKHHDRPLGLSAKEGLYDIHPMPMLNHTDQELTMLEALVGRTPPFPSGSSNYDRR